MAAATEITPVVEPKVLGPGWTLPALPVRPVPGEVRVFEIPTNLEGPEPPASEISVEFTQSGPKVTVTVVAEVPSALPNSLMFGALVHPTLRLRKAIPLQVSKEESCVVLNWEEAGEFACGDTLGDALDDFGKTVSELYSELNAPQVRLGEQLERVRFILNEYIGPR